MVANVGLLWQILHQCLTLIFFMIVAFFVVVLTPKMPPFKQKIVIGVFLLLLLSLLFPVLLLHSYLFVPSPCEKVVLIRYCFWFLRCIYSLFVDFEWLFSLSHLPAISYIIRYLFRVVENRHGLIPIAFL